MALIGILICGLWLISGGCGPAPGPPPPPSPKEAPPPEVRHWPYFRTPENLILCGEAVPLDDPVVREDLDREFTIVVWSRTQTTMWLKRANRYFPEIEMKLRKKLLPLDLKYVVLVESDLRPKAKSPAGALGFWQFILPTAQRFQLKTSDKVDERLEFGASTDAALQYLQVLHRLFGNWALALAAYNCGEGRVQKEMTAQGVGSFYYLSLPEETERYVHRILAAKIILEDPARYGYDIPPDQLYPPLSYDEVEFTAAQEMPVKRLAEVCGTYYKAIKSLNPWIKTAALPPGSYRLKVPKGSGSRFQEAYRQGRL
ncbi:MAG: lytic transglycosylase domain-containing protein [Deltaproteobacteria bacterium]|nr:lytic transglycosylase domain-containing protein [Deltaproteobacteria bacterium]